MAQYLPKAWREASVSAKELTAKREQAEIAAKAVTARIDMSEDVAGRGLCPNCRQPMQAGFKANGHDVLVCMKDRIAIPLADATAPEV